VGSLLKTLGVSFDPDTLRIKVELHKATLRYFFERRMKNLSLVAGVALCLGLNINAMTIWDTLYHDQGVRAKFSSPQSMDSVMKQYEELQKNQENSAQAAGSADLAKQRENLKKEVNNFRGEVNFGVGRIWTERGESPKLLLYEFFGSLLTGILASIGAPYWHDLLRALANLRIP
jgi:hypothetical protein